MKQLTVWALATLIASALGCSEPPARPNDTTAEAANVLGTPAPEPVPARPHDPARHTILVVGDSLSAGYGLAAGTGWVDLLDLRLRTDHSEWQAVNASISGDTTSGGLARLPAALERYQPAVVVLELGGNDGLRGYPVERIHANLQAMVDQSLAADAQVVLVGMHIPPSYGPRYTEAFHGVYQQLAQRQGVSLVPFLLDGIATDAGLMQADGIHPTAAAQPLLLANAWPAIAAVVQPH